jgi:phosphomannomutase
MLPRGRDLSGLLACVTTWSIWAWSQTPVIQHAISRRGAAGGVSIGASHNGAEWNALKFLGPGGTYLSTAEAGELLDLYHLRRFSFATLGRGWDSSERRVGGNHQYLEDLAAVYDFTALKRFKLVIDCANGTSPQILRTLAERHGFQFILINERQGSVRARTQHVGRDGGAAARSAGRAHRLRRGISVRRRFGSRGHGPPRGACRFRKR